MSTYSSILPLVTPRWLLEVTDARRVRRALEEIEPALGRSGSSIKKCKVKLRVLGADGRWMGSVPIEVEEPGGAGAVREVLLAARFSPPDRRADGDRAVARGRFGEPGWRCRIPELGLELATRADEDDPPGRSLLMDPDRVRGLLQESIRGARTAWRGVVVSSCQPEETRRKLASRSTVRYRLGYEPGSPGAGPDQPPAVVVAKAYRPGTGSGTFSAMSALWTSALRRSATVRIAEPIAYHPEIDVLVQGPVPEEATLKELIGDILTAPDPTALGRLGALLERTATGLAELHRCGVNTGPRRGWEEELGEVEGRLRALGAVIPQVEGLGRELVDRAGAILGPPPPGGEVPSHGGFRAAQVLVAGHDIGFIDFDSFCMADPAMDLAEFVRFLVQEGFGEPDCLDGAEARARLSLLDDLSDAVLDSYRATAQVDPQRVVAWQALGWLNRLLAGWAKAKTDRLAIDAHLMDHFLARWGLPGAPFAL